MIKRMLILLMFLIPATVNAYECTGEIKTLAKEYQINIICDPSGFINSSRIHAEIPEQYLLENITPYLNMFLSSYSRDFIKTHVTNLYLVKDLTLDGSEVAGLSDGKNIWIKTMIYHGRNRSFYLVAMHHEFSSNILKSNFTDFRKWKDSSKEEYDQSLSFFRENLASYEFSRSTSQTLYLRGFLCNYGKTNPENDFNTYAETLFANPQKIKYLSGKYKIIEKKLTILKFMYRKNGFVGKFPDET